MTYIRPSFVTAALAAALLFGTAAQAHPKLLTSSPAANATVAKTTKIELHFNEALVGQFSGVELSMTDMPGMKMNSPMKMGPVAAVLGPDGKTLVATPKTPLSPGTYKLDWHAVTIDTHRVSGSFSFKVR